MLMSANWHSSKETKLLLFAANPSQFSWDRSRKNENRMDLLIPTRQPRMQVTADLPVGCAASSRIQSDAARAWLIAFSLMLFGYVVIPFDTVIASLMKKHHDWTGWKLVHLSEIFSHAWGVGLIALGISSLHALHAPKIPQLFCASLGAGLVANIGKLICARTRPHSFDLTASSWESFQGLFPWWNGVYESSTNLASLQSFPSAHSATAAGLAWGLSRLYPQGRWYFVLLCMLALCQRLVVQAHFLSDVCWGAAIGVIWANFVFSNVKLGQRFGRLEEWLTKRWKIQSEIA
jgi:membrane-associated phospholipid phosphatase